jgi:hypothetical protein
VKETTVEEHLIAGVRARRGMCIKFLPSVAGVPDRIVFLPTGRIFLAELKAPDGQLRPDQIVMHKRLAQRGVPVAVLSSTDAVDAWLDSLDTAS